MTVIFAPLPGRYAVMRLNPAATLEQYGYEDLLVAATKDLQPKSYLVYLDQASIENGIFEAGS